MDYLTNKSDVYHFEVVLLENLTGRKPIDCKNITPKTPRMFQDLCIPQTYIHMLHKRFAKKNRVEEAVEHLSVYLDKEDVVLLCNDDDKAIWSIKRGIFGGCKYKKRNIDGSNDSIFMMADEPKGITYLNMVRIYVMSGEIEKARHFASKALSLHPDKPKVLLPSFYMDILQSKAQ